MKSKFFNPLVSLATSVLLLSVVNKAFAQDVVQTNLEKPQALMFDLETSRTTSSMKFPTTIEPAQSTQANSVIETDQVSEPVGGLFVTFVFVVYILIGLQYRKHRNHRATLLLQQIETLERIWNMQSHR
jgi:hypothetical protein